MSETTKRKRKPVITLQSITITCDEQSGSVSADDLFFSANSSACEMCGTHGNVFASFKCPVCGKQHALELESW